MDHHLIPKNATADEIKVPYVCTEPYDGESFLTYPERKGKPWMLASDGFLTPQIHESFYPTPTKEQEAFFQTWMFFGLLHAILGPIFDARDFIQNDGDTQSMTTTKLMAKLGQSWDRLQQSDTKDQVEKLSYLSKCLQLINQNLPFTRDDFDWQIAMSIASVCELISEALNNLGNKIEVEAPRILPRPFPPDEIKSQMLRAGWCPSEIVTVGEKFKSLQSRILISRMDKASFSKLSQKPH